MLLRVRRVPPILGLILTLTGLWSFSAAATQFLIFVEPQYGSFPYYYAFEGGCAALQVACGLAVIRESPVARALLVLWSLALAASGAYLISDLGPTSGPLSVVGFVQYIAPALFTWLAPVALRDGDESTRRTELGTSLLLLTVSGLIGQVLWLYFVFTQIGTLSWEPLLWGAYMLARSIVAVATAIYANRHLGGSSGRSARRALRVYVTVALVLHLVDLVLMGLSVLLTNQEHSPGVSVFVSPIITLVSLWVIWSYARRELTADELSTPVSPHGRASAAAWSALWIVPRLVVALLLVVVGGTATFPVEGWKLALLFGGIGLTTMILFFAGVGALRAWRLARVWAALGLALAVGCTTLILQDLESVRFQELSLVRPLLGWGIAIFGVMWWQLRPIGMVPTAIVRR
jgi:hypothetical protein